MTEAEKHFSSTRAQITSVFPLFLWDAVYQTRYVGGPNSSTQFTLCKCLWALLSRNNFAILGVRKKELELYMSKLMKIQPQMSQQNSWKENKSPDSSNLVYGWSSWTHLFTKGEKKSLKISSKGTKRENVVFWYHSGQIIGSLTDYAYTKMFVIKGQSLSNKVTPIVAVCSFFCHKLLENL